MNLRREMVSRLFSFVELEPQTQLNFAPVVGLGGHTAEVGVGRIGEARAAARDRVRSARCPDSDGSGN